MTYGTDLLNILRSFTQILADKQTEKVDVLTSFCVQHIPHKSRQSPSTTFGVHPPALFVTECRFALGYSRLFVHTIRRFCHSKDTASSQFLCCNVYSRRAMAQTSHCEGTGSTTGKLHVGFMVYKMPLGEVFLLLLLLFVSI